MKLKMKSLEGSTGIRLFIMGDRAGYLFHTQFKFDNSLSTIL